jgi:hypothetical protein
MLAVVTVAAVLVAACGGATSASTSVAGMWVGTGTVSAGGPSSPIAYYLDLTMGANRRITGSGMGCTAGVRAILTISGAPGGSDGVYTMDWMTSDLGPAERTLHVSAQASGSQMTISGSDSSTTPPTTSSATLIHGSMNDYNAKCTSLPTPMPSAIAGTWVGAGTITTGGHSQQFAVYLDLTTGTNGQIIGAGAACVVGFTDHFTITGAPSSSTDSYTMQWTKTDPTGTTHTLSAMVHVSGSQMTLSGSDPSTSPPTTNSATLMHGSMNDYNAKCNSLPTPVPSS